MRGVVAYPFANELAIFAGSKLPGSPGPRSATFLPFVRFASDVCKRDARTMLEIVVAGQLSGRDEARHDMS